MQNLDKQVKDIILEYGMIEKHVLADLEDRAKRIESTLLDEIILGGYMKDEELGQLLADKLGVPFIKLNQIDIPEDILFIIPEAVAKKHQIVAYEKTKDMLKIATFKVDNLEMFYFLKKKTSLKIDIGFATKFGIADALLQYRKNMDKLFADLLNQYRSTGNVDDEESGDKEFPIIDMVDNIIKYAYQYAASDIHIEPHQKDFVIRYRIDGVLHDMLHLPKDIMPLIVTRLKIMAKLRIDEHMAAMDGKILFKTDNGRADIRVSIIPITNGEKIVMRLMPEKRRQYVLTELGLSEVNLKIIRKAITRPHGMILVTGPTGSGKTTTLYAILRELNSRDVNIATIEDPVEYEMEGVNQIQVNPKTDLTFAKGLRSILRQDPDIIMVGEIRDEDTAKISINAAMTGHLVLSTLHTNDAATTLPRLIDMGIEPFLIASSVNIAIAQRLLRRICTQCIISQKITYKELQDMFPNLDLSKIVDKKTKEFRVYKGAGCHVCNKIGYKGRIGIFEVLEIKDNIKKLIMSNANSDEIRDTAIRENGMVPLQYDALSKALLGQTTLEEVLKLNME